MRTGRLVSFPSTTTATTQDLSKPVQRDAYGYCNLEGDEAAAFSRLVIDYQEWWELEKEYEEKGIADRLTMLKEASQTAFAIIARYQPVVCHYASGGNNIFSFQRGPGAWKPREWDRS